MTNMKVQKNVQVAEDALTSLTAWVESRKDSIDLWQAFSAAVRRYNTLPDEERLMLALDEERREFEAKQKRLLGGVKIAAKTLRFKRGRASEEESNSG